MVQMISAPLRPSTRRAAAAPRPQPFRPHLENARATQPSRSRTSSRQLMAQLLLGLAVGALLWALGATAGGSQELVRQSVVGLAVVLLLLAPRLGTADAPSSPSRARSLRS